MAKELVISSNRHETKVAVLEDEQLVEIYFQRANEYSLAGSIHKGRVTRVLPGMQSAFVDIGLERDAFLYVSDFYEEHEEYDKMPMGPEGRARRPQREEGAQGPRAPIPAPQAETAENLRDRRGRRSRRRRSRGREFPDSKYAAPLHEVEETIPESELPVLPGESLAKYQSLPGSGPQAAEPWESESGGGAEIEAALELPDEEARELEARAAAFFFEQGRPEQPDQAARESFSEEAIEEREQGPAEPDAAPEPPSQSPASVETEDAAVRDAAREFEALFRGPLAAPAEAVEEDQTAGLKEPAVLPADISQQDSGCAPEEEPEIDEEEESALETAGPTAESVAAEQAEALAESLGTPEAEAAEPGAAQDQEPGDAAVEPQAPVTAAVREPAPRLPHRISRRLRKKLRGQLQVEGRIEPAKTPAAKPEPETATAPEPEKTGPSITDLLREGQEILVQIAKEPLGQKGARITSHIALPGRYVVYMPTVDHPGVSRKISSEEERARLRRIIQTHRVGMPGGFIVRTAGEGRSESEIAADMTYLYNLWLDIRQKAEKRPAPSLIYHDLDVVQRILRDQLTEDYKTIWVDSEDVYESVLRFVERVQPNMVPRVKLYTRSVPIFDAFNITNELEKALRPKVWLKSGGYIVVNQTEALVAIDVNTGKFVGSSNRLEDTIVKTNIEAIREIVRQIRLRDLGGIIVVDFIDMDERKNRQKVMQALEEEMRRDRAPYKILQFNDFGLVAITRKRVKQSLERTLCSPCPYCEGAGYVKSVQTVVSEILQEARKIADAVEGPNVVLRVNPEVAKVLKATSNDYLEELEEILKRPVLVTGDPLLHQEKWDMG